MARHADSREAETARGIVLRFQEAVFTLAASPADQVRACPAGFRLVAESMADDFDHWSAAVMPLLPPEREEAVGREVRVIEGLFGALDSWAPGSLESEAWQAIRAHARNIAVVMGWVLQAPPPWAEQVQAQARWHPEADPIYPLFGGLLSDADS